MSSDAEARFRVREPAKADRVVKVLALDRASDNVVARLSERPWRHSDFFPSSALDEASPSTGASPAARRSVLDEVADADLVVMVAAEGGHAGAAALVGEVCSQKRVMTTSLVVHTAHATDESISRTLAQVRPWSLMVAVVSDERYVEDILRSFR